MATKKLKPKNYSVTFKIVVDTSFNIAAESFEQALEKARAYGVKDIVDFDSDFNDGNVTIVGLYDFGEALK